MNPRHSIADALIEACGTSDAGLLPRIRLPREWISRKINALSEGQRARVAIARSAAPLTTHTGRGGLLILDEPLSGLDPSTRSAILDYLRAAQAEHGLSILLITHDREIAAELGARVVPFASGRVAA